jgi:hypothetical protein
LVVASRQTDDREVRGGLTLALHASRTTSPASELRAIECILQADGSPDEAMTVKEIAAQTGMSVQTVRRRLRLRTLTAGLRAAFDEGWITSGIAEAAARLSDEQQTRLERELEEEGRLTLAGSRELAAERHQGADADSEPRRLLVGPAGAVRRATGRRVRHAVVTGILAWSTAHRSA